MCSCVLTVFDMGVYACRLSWQMNSFSCYQLHKDYESEQFPLLHCLFINSICYLIKGGKSFVGGLDRTLTLPHFLVI